MELQIANTPPDLSSHVLNHTIYVSSSQRLLPPNTSKFEIHVVSLVVVLAPGLGEEDLDLVRSPWLGLPKFSEHIPKQS